MTSLVCLALLLAAEPDPPHPTTLYLEFSGGWVVPGEDNAALGSASCVDEVLFPPLTDPGGLAEAIGLETRSLFRDYGVRVHWGTRPPAHLPYVIVYVGEWSRNDSSHRGASCVVDCGDPGRRDVAFVDAAAFTDDPALLARTIAHEAGHGFGLEHVIDATDIMARFLDDGAAAWQPRCLALSNEDTCATEHARWCPAGAQNSHAELLGLFGGPEPDTTPPSIRIVSPRSGEIVAAGARIRLEVEVGDDRAGFGWKFSAPDLGWEQVAFHGETFLELVVPEVPEGDITFVVEAIDQDLNASRDQVTIEIGELSASDAMGCECGLGHDRVPSAWIALFSLLVTGGHRRRHRADSC